MRKGLSILGVLFCGLLAGGSIWAAAQNPLIPNPLMSGVSPKERKRKHAPEKNSPQPTFAIPVTQLGFSEPAAFYLGSRFSQVSLHFLDEDHLLFTFRVPGLISRERQPGPQPSGDTGTERRIHAVVLALPSGQITAEAIWTLHDYRPYLWMLNNQRFLLRDQNQLRMGDAALHLEPFLRFPGTVLHVELDPDQQLLITSTVEPKTAGVASTGNSPVPDTAAVSKTPVSDDDSKNTQTQNMLRILRMDSLKVLMAAPVTGIPHLPADGEGYYEVPRGKGMSWVVSYSNFHGGVIPLYPVDSTCMPALDVLTRSVIMASSCATNDWHYLTAIRSDLSRDFTHGPGHSDSKDKQRLWEISTSPYDVWPVLARSTSGTRFARALLHVEHPVNANNPLNPEEIHSQTVSVYDMATGKSPLSLQVSPILDGGGNFALSPSGNRFAVLNSGQIQVFELPPAPPLPSLAAPVSK